jgi:3-hydroxyacyl-[acyl-carrier-protein] dehydratase
MLDINQLTKILPQRYPFLLIDKVIELIPGEKVTAIKNVSINEPYFIGHFPGEPLMPGALILEAMAQASIVLYHSHYQEQLKNGAKYFLSSISKAEFKYPVVPGDQLRMEAKTIRLIPTAAIVSVIAYVGDKLVAKAEFVFGVKPNE